MSDPRLHVKKIGYLAATQSFDEKTEVVLLLGNLLKKDMSSKSNFEVALALDCLSNVVTEELANVLVSDVYELLNAPSSYVRKKATLVLYKMFLRYPDALRPSFKRLQEKLSDTDPGVVVAAVTVMTELAMRNPKNYLPLAPLFFRLLQENASGNWMMIKLVKLFGMLAPHEPRLLKKLSSPMMALLQGTTAKSLLYECLNTITGGLQRNEELVAAAMRRVNEFVGSPDLNLKYLGLKVLMNVGREYPAHVYPYKDIVLASLSDADPTIQQCALRLVVNMITPATLPELATALLELILEMVVGDEGNQRRFRDELVFAVLDVCSKDRYSMLEDFGQYVGVLVDLARLPGRPHSELIGGQLIDITVRVDEVKADALAAATALVGDYSMYSPPPSSATRPREAHYRAITSAAWIVGELAGMIDADGKCAVVETLLRREVAGLLPASSQAVYLTAALKVLGSVGAGDAGLAARVAGAVAEGIHRFETSSDIDVRDRAAELAAIVGMGAGGGAEGGAGFWRDVGAVYEDFLNPVSAKAQSRVPVPEGLSFTLPEKGAGAPHDEDAQSMAGSEVSDGGAVGAHGGAADEEDEEDEEDGDGGGSTSAAARLLTKKSKKDLARAQEQARERLSQHRQRHGMFYLGEGAAGASPPPDAAGAATASPASTAGSIPVDEILAGAERIALDGGAEAGGRGSPFFSGLSGGFAKRTSSSSSPRVIKDDETLPSPQKPPAPASARGGDRLDVDLTSPLSSDERLPSLRQYPKAAVVHNDPDHAWAAQPASDGFGAPEPPASSSGRRRSSRSKGGEGEGEDEKKHRRRRKSGGKKKEGDADEEAGGGEKKKKKKKKRDKGGDAGAGAGADGDE